MLRACQFRRFLGTAVLALATALIGGRQAAAEPPAVVASIKPVHSLVAGVMAGVGRPYLLLKGGSSPHTYSLRPSDAKALARARLVFWIGEDMERFLVRPLKTIARRARSVELIEAKGLRLHQMRAGGVWAGHAGAHPTGHAGHAHGDRHGQAGKDLHIWLDPRNAGAMVRTIAAALIEADPANEAAYRRNAAASLARLQRLDGRLAAKLAPVRRTGFIVFHDAYQYFEKRYGLNAAGSITLDPARKPGARRLSAIRKTVKRRGARCVFTEPQFQPDLVRTVIDGTGARAAMLDPIGAALPAGPEAYFTLMGNLAIGLKTCLAGNS